MSKNLPWPSRSPGGQARISRPTLVETMYLLRALPPEKMIDPGFREAGAIKRRGIEIANSGSQAPSSVAWASFSDTAW